MPRDRRPAVQKYHDRVAPRYDHSYDDAFWKWHDALTWDHLKTFLPSRVDAPVIDLGCGTGKWGLKLLTSGYPVTFVDISHRMLEQVRQGIARLGGPAAGRTRCVQADLSDLSGVESAGFALATAFGEPIGCTPDPPATLRQIRRILAPDGVLVGTIDNRLAAIEHYVEKGDAAVLSRFLRTGRTHWLTKDSSEQFEITTYGPAELRRVLLRAGFEVVDLIGKTVLPMRHHRALLAESPDRRRWAKIEKSLCRDEDAIGRAPHLQFAARVLPDT